MGEYQNVSQQRDLTESMLLGGAERKGDLIIRPDYVPIEKVKIPWVIEAAKSVYPITDINNRPPGTAFHLRSGIWVTNHHCVYYQRGVTMDEKLAVSVISTRPPISLAGASISPKENPGYDHHGTGDIVVLQTGSRNIPPIKKTKAYRPGVEIPCLMIGFPSNLPLEQGPYISWGGEAELYDKYPIHGRCTLRNNPGTSGSPIFDLDGNLIGIFSGNFQALKRIEELVGELKNLGN